MPAGYLKIKRQFLAKGYSEKEAAKHAARIWNETHKGKEAVHGGDEDNESKKK